MIYSTRSNDKINYDEPRECHINICSLCNVRNIYCVCYTYLVLDFLRRLSRSHGIYFIAKTNNSSIPIIHRHWSWCWKFIFNLFQFCYQRTLSFPYFDTIPSQKRCEWYWPWCQGVLHSVKSRLFILAHHAVTTADRTKLTSSWKTEVVDSGVRVSITFHLQTVDGKFYCLA